MANLTDADKILRNDTGKDIASKLDIIAGAIGAEDNTYSKAQSDMRFVKKEDGASGVAFDNTGTELESTNVEDVIKEIDGSLSTVATSGNYDDLNNKPSVAVIDDTQASASKVYSSNKVDSLVGNLSTIIKFGLNEIDTACTRWVNTRLQCTISNAKKGMVFRLKNPSSLALGMKISAVQKGDTDLSVWTQAPYELTQDYDNVYFQISTVNADKSISDEVMATIKIVVSNNCPIEIDTAKAKAESLIAPIDTTIVLNNYKVGDYFIVGDKLLKAIVDISIGTTLSVGTNCEIIQKGISNEVSELYKTLYGFDKIEPAFTTLFDNPNLFVKGFYKMTNLICNANGKITSTNGTALIIPVEPSTTYTLLQENDYLDTRLVLSNTTDDFEVNSTYNVLSNVNLDNHNKITIQTAADSKFICYCFTSRYDIDLNSIVFSIYKSNDLTITDKIKAKYIPVEATGNQLNGKNVLIFGDSIMQLPNTDTQRGKTAGDYFADVTGANVKVLAVGGTTLSRTVANLPSDASTFENANACVQICSMIEFLVSGDFTTLDEALITLENAGRLDSYTKDVTVPLMKTIDLDSVDIILISGGTNDCTSGRPLDDGNDGSLVPTNINGAINLIAKTILQNYPKIKLFFFTPIIRQYIYNDDSSWSDDYCPNGINKLLPDYAEQIEISAKANHIPSCDMYWKMGWNKYNFLSFCQGEDTTHPRNGGFKPMGEKMASFVSAHI